jgi:uncharacterized phage-associated protein
MGATRKMIEELPQRYRIGKRPLSILLGWGELTYSRFMAGAEPSAAYSRTIEELFRDPLSYRTLLENNHATISEVAYRKSLKAVNEVIQLNNAEDQKMLEVASVLCGLSQGFIGAIEIEKLTYFAQGLSLVLLDGPLFALEPEAWAAGPVYPTLWKTFRAGGASEVYGDGRLAINEGTSLTEGQERLVEAVWDTFGGYSGAVLSQMTHLVGPWTAARKRGRAADGEAGNEPISIADMQRYFDQKIPSEGTLEERVIGFAQQEYRDLKEQERGTTALPLAVTSSEMFYAGIRHAQAQVELGEERDAAAILSDLRSTHAR